MLTLTVSEIHELYKKLMFATGNSPGIRDVNLLESAVFGCYQTFDGIELYPTIIEKAARMAYAVCKNHPFIDGNKRAAVTTMLVMLRLNSILLSYTQQELICLGINIANGSIGYNDIVDWINNHL